MGGIEMANEDWEKLMIECDENKDGNVNPTHLAY
jgi:hypothetical protein